MVHPRKQSSTSGSLKRRLTSLEAVTHDQYNKNEHILEYNDRIANMIAKEVKNVLFHEKMFLTSIPVGNAV